MTSVEPIRTIDGMTFGIIGGMGYIAGTHKKVIESLGGQIIWNVDPSNQAGGMFKGTDYLSSLEQVEERYDLQNFGIVDYIVICSPSYMHQRHIEFALEYGGNVICEKPMCLPWERPILDDRINVVLQMRYIPNLPSEARIVRVQAVRNKEYFSTWKGKPRNTGGLLFHILIHYIDLAIFLNADFQGIVTDRETVQEREIITHDGSKLNLYDYDKEYLYRRLYEDVLAGKGIKSRDLQFLHWQMERNSDLIGYGQNGMNRTIHINHEDL